MGTNTSPPRTADRLADRYGYALDLTRLRIAQRLEAGDCTQTEVRRVLGPAWALDVTLAVHQAKLNDAPFSL